MTQNKNNENNNFDTTCWTKKKILIVAFSIVLCAAICTTLFVGFSGKKITKLGAQYGYNKAFENVSGISVANDKERYVITEEDAIDKVLTLLKSVRVKAKPIKKENSFDFYDKNQITINGKTFYFDKGFEKIFLTDELEVYTYKVLNPKMLKSASAVKDVNETTPIISEISVGSDVYGLSATVNDIKLDDNEPYIVIEYSNSTDTDYTNGEYFDVLYKSGANYQSCAKSDVFFEDIAYFLKSGETRLQQYDLTCFDFARDGKYRFETEFSNQNLWIEFNLENKPKNEITEEQEATKQQEDEINRLKAKYPQYFNLPTVNGLELYVELSKFHPNFPVSTYFRLFAGNNLGYAYGDMVDIEGVSEDEMKLILSTYKDVASSEINIVVYNNLFSRFYVENPDSYIAQFRNKLDLYNKDFDSYLHFKATIVETRDDGTIVVEAFKEESAAISSKVFELNINGVYDDSIRALKVGDKVRIAYMGELQQTSVIKIDDVKTVVLIDDGIY